MGKKGQKFTTLIFSPTRRFRGYCVIILDGCFFVFFNHKSCNDISLKRYDIISVPSYAAGIYHRSQSDIISKIYHPFRKERISLKKASFVYLTKETFFVVPLTGLEPVQYRYRGILSPLCLPIPPQRRGVSIILPHFLEAVNPKSRPKTGRTHPGTPRSFHRCAKHGHSVPGRNPPPSGRGSGKWRILWKSPPGP